MKRSLFLRWFGESWRENLFGDKRRGPLVGRRRARPAIRLGVEQLEDRTLLSVLPAITPLGVTSLPLAGSSASPSNTPSIAYDPLNPQHMVAAFSTKVVNEPVNFVQGVELAFSVNGGQNWLVSGIMPENIDFSIPPPKNMPPPLFADATDPSVAFDRNGNFYVVYAEENAPTLAGRTTAGQIVLQKYSFSGGAPVNIISDKILYQWAAQDPALNPMVAVDNNLRTFQDPQTLATQTDPFVDPVTGIGPVYVAWNMNDTAPTGADLTKFNPNKIQIIASSDGGNTFSTQIPVNDGINVGLDRDAFPRLVVSQGTVSGRPSAGVSGGEVNIVWNNFANSSLVSSTIQNGGVGALANGSTGGITNALGTARLYLNAQNYAVGTAPIVVATGDFNGDGHQDVATLDQSSKTITVLRGTGDGFFYRPKVTTTLSSTPLFMAAGDFNGDGRTDLALLSQNSSVVTILTGNTDGTFTATATYDLGTNAKTLVVTDLRKPGNSTLDLAVVTTDDKVHILLGNGDGTFNVQATTYTVGTGVAAIAAGDFNKDGKVDLITGNSGSNDVTVLVGNGNGTFATTAVSSPAGGSVTALSVADFNKDGYDDVAVLISGSSNIGILINAAAGNSKFKAAATIAGNLTSTAILAGDFNGDGNPDIATADGTVNTVTVFTGKGDGTFNASVSFSVDQNAVSLAAGDFNGDNRLDLAVANQDSNDVSILIGNKGTGNTAQITSFTANVNITDPNFTTVSDFDVTLNVVHPHLREIKVILFAPDGNSITLLQNGVDSAGAATGNGVADAANLGVLNTYDVGTTFDDQAARSITDTNAKAPYTAHFQAEGGSLASLAVGRDKAGINGTWKLVIIDFRSHANQVESVDNWSLNFTSKLTPNQNRLTVKGGSVIGGAVIGPYPDKAAVAPDRGVGPGLSLAVDNTLGSFSSFQGRLYAAYTGGGGSDPNVFLVTSDDGGGTWSQPVKINDDFPGDGFSEGDRAQFEPNVAVDPLTGTLVISFYDARHDASNARVATYVATSIDGGETFSPQTFLNPTRNALDAVTGNTVQLEPIPDNSSSGNPSRDKTFGFGDRQGVVAFGGQVTAVWAGDQNAGSESIQVGRGVIAAGPRIVSSTMGPVSDTGINNTFASDGTLLADRFRVQFDRPVDPATFTTGQVQVMFRNPTTPASMPGILLDNVSVTPVDPGLFGPAQIAGATLFEVVFDPTKAKTLGGTYTGTYSYAVGPAIADRIRQPGVTVVSGTPIGLQTATDTPIPIPPDSGPGQPDTGGTNSPHTLSHITITGIDPTLLITHIAVQVRIDHTYDSDLQIQLIGPDGTTKVTLSQNEGSSGHNFGNGTTSSPPITPTIFDDNGATPISAGSAPFVGTFTPETPLAVLNGISPNGTWTLDIQDQFELDIGTLLTWSLDISAGTATTIVNGGNKMDQDASGKFGAVTDVYAAPRPLSGIPFQLPYDQNTLPLIVPGPHVVSTDVPGNPATPDNLVLNGTTNSIDVVFDRDMNASTFTPASIVRMFGPAGQINGPFTITADPPGTAAALALRTFRIGFPTQQLSGTYTVVLGPNVLSAAGEAMDTNMNAGLDTLRGGNQAGSPTFLIGSIISSGGIATATTTTANSFVTGDQVTISGANESAYNGTFAIVVTSPSTFTYGVPGNPPSPASGNGITVSKSTIGITAAYTGAAVALPAGKTTTIPITVNTNFLVQGASILLNIIDSHDPDLEATLVAPDGTQIKLFTNVGDSGTRANFTNTVLSDLALTPIQNGQPPFNGAFDPQQPLSMLVGKASAGVYKLVIKNDSTTTAGTLKNWSLSLLQSLPGTGLGEAVADQATATFRIFTMDPSNPISHNTWTAVGPASINSNGNSGRIGGLAVDPSDPSGNTVYVGGASGGVWKTTDFLTTDSRGPTYTPLTDFGPTFGINIGSIAVFARNNDPNQSILVAGTGEADTASTGVGFLRSTNGGATWTLLDSSTNVDANGNELPINSPQRDHIFVGTSTFKVIIDPVAAPSGERIIFAALIGANGGIWRSVDTGKHWTKVRGGTATDVLFAPASASVSTGNLQILYGAFQGEGVFISQDQGSSWNPMAGGVGNPLIRNPDTSGISVAAPSDTPNGAKGRIVLATPFLTGNRVQDLGYEGWLYAAVVTKSGGGSFDGVYLTKDFGQNWTKIALPVVPNPIPEKQFPTNNETRPSFNVTGDTLFTQGNYDLSLGIDPNNPNVVYVGGTADGNLSGFVRVDTTGVIDPKNVTSHDNSNSDGGQTQTATTGSISGGAFDGLVLTDPNTGKTIIQPTINALRDPFQPFLANATLVAGSPGPSDVGGSFTNSGQDIRWSPFDKLWNPLKGAFDIPNDMLTGTTDQHRIITMRDPLTGQTRLILGDDQGVFTGVDQGNGQLFESLGSVTDLSSTNGDVPVVTGSRNGNLQITQFYYGATQPSILAAQIGQALFYGNAQDDGFPVSTPDILATGNIQWTGPTGDGSGIATDQTGTGTMYTYQWPGTGLHTQPTDFFSVNPKGQFDPTTGLFTSRTFGLLEKNNIVPPPGVPDPQWPYLAQGFGHDVAQSNIAVNPINGDQLLISSAAGRIFRTSTQGLTWFKIGFVSGDTGATAANTLDGSYAPALAYGAPDPANPSGNLDDFIYVGTINGNIFVTFNGGGSFTQISGGLDGSSVLAMATNPLRGSHEAYAVTLNGVYHMVDSSKAGATWQKINGNLFALMHSAFGDPSLAAVEASFLTSIVADWRFVIPDSPANPTGPTHPALYVGGEAGVFRSLDNGKTWTIFPDVAHDGSPVDGGYLPLAHISNLQLAVGNINPTTGKPDQAGDDLLVLRAGLKRPDIAAQPARVGGAPQILQVIPVHQIRVVLFADKEPVGILRQQAQTDRVERGHLVNEALRVRRAVENVVIKAGDEQSVVVGVDDELG